MKIQALVLCGGKGERLRPLTSNIPKPMIKIKDKTILEYIIDHILFYDKFGNLKWHFTNNNNIDRILYSINFSRVLYTKEGLEKVKKVLNLKKHNKCKY